MAIYITQRNQPLHAEEAAMITTSSTAKTGRPTDWRTRCQRPTDWARR